jgi:hypothetical protein
MKSVSTGVVIVVVITATAGCSNGRAVADAEHPATLRDQVLSGLAAKYGADVSWQKSLERPDRRRMYTFEIQKFLVRNDKTPLVVTARIDDVVDISADTFEVRGHTTGSLGRRLQLRLRCSPSVLNHVLTRSPHAIDDYAFVVRFDKVSKPMFTTSAEHDLSADVDTPEVIVEPSDMLLADGQCLAARGESR